MQEAQKIVFPNLPPRLEPLGEIANNLWWSWHPGARMVFKKLDRRAWKESGHNPVLMLREMRQEVLEEAAGDPEYLRHLDVVLAHFRRDVDARGGWFWSNIQYPDSANIAYFSAEYGLHHSLPFFAGGLGFLAGDHVKECSDLGVPLVAVGFMYPEGYLRQKIREDGWQENLDEDLDRDAASITRVLDENRNQMVVKVPLIEPPVYVAVWKVTSGRISIYLLDTDIDANSPSNRRITAHLYVGDMEQRLRQEIVLGIGGTEVLEKLGIEHSVLHLNEGHPAFALLERIRDRLQQGLPFDEALRQVQATSVFTTHTPVPAGHDVFPSDLIEKYFKSYRESLGLDSKSFLDLGTHPQEPEAGFNMTAFALKLCGYRNGVSQRHGEVTRQMWQGLWSGTKTEDVPIDHITNGIHVPSWIAPKMELLFNEFLGPDWLEDHDNPVIWELIDDIPDDRLWEIHWALKLKLINYVREEARKRWAYEGASPTNVVSGGALLDPSALTIGFARRFATYKRADLIFQDTERLKKLVNNRWRPLQLIFAGKAHPADDPAKKILQHVYNAAHDPDFGGRIGFVADYNEQVSQYMVHGVDIWLNNPLPPLEASGTSGMKAALNGVPSLSVLDGWWVEGYNSQNGWAFGDGQITGERNQADAEALYQLLENAIIPLYYRRADGVPCEWVKIMKESIKSNGPRFSARRMVKEYTNKFYAPALSNA
ncbi:MAG: alpha-glucan family phosphorylase [Chloroflexi bacterium]|nr:alpha-glucan family phosphorylase [Chloroflexota bacterium]